MARKGKTVKEVQTSTEFNPKEIEQTHGSLDNKEQVRTVEKIAGYKTRYETTDFSKYQEYIRMLSNADLYDHAYAVSVTPIDNRNVLEARLEKKFLEENTPNIFRVVPIQMSAEAMERQKRIIDGTF